MPRWLSTGLDAAPVFIDKNSAGKDPKPSWRLPKKLVVVKAGESKSAAKAKPRSKPNAASVLGKRAREQSAAPALAAPRSLPLPAVPPVAAAAQPIAAQLVAAQPVAALPVAAQPVAAQPVAALPVAAQPVAAMPVAAQPVAAQLVADQPPGAQQGGAGVLAQRPARGPKVADHTNIEGVRWRVSCIFLPTSSLYRNRSRALLQVCGHA